MSNNDHNTARAKYLDARKLVQGSPPPGSLGSTITEAMARGMAITETSDSFDDVLRSLRPDEGLLVTPDGKAHKIVRWAIAGVESEKP